MDLALLGNMSIILITAVIVLLVFNKLKLPTMIGLFLPESCLVMQSTIQA